MINGAKKAAIGHLSVWQLARNKHFLVMAMVCAGASATGSALSIWQPQLLKSFGLTNLQTGLINSIPYGIASVMMVLWGRHSDRTLERRFHSALGYLAGAVGLVGIGLLSNNPALAFAALVLAVACPLAAVPVFWQIPPMVLAGTGAAGGIALINSIGALASWGCPSVVGWLEDVTGKTASGLYVVAGLVAIGSALILIFMRPRLQEN